MSEGTDGLHVRPLTADDAPAYRKLRLKALATDPEAFTASIEEEAALSDAEMIARAAPQYPSVTFGAFVSDTLAGMAGYIANTRAKTAHKATMVAVFVAPQWRSSGAGLRLVEAVIAHARSQRVILQCAVRADNERARRLYYRLGFERYGIEKAAVREGHNFVDDELLALDLRDTGGSGT